MPKNTKRSIKLGTAGLVLSSSQVTTNYDYYYTTLAGLPANPAIFSACRLQYACIAYTTIPGTYTHLFPSEEEDGEREIIMIVVPPVQ